MVGEESRVNDNGVADEGRYGIVTTGTGTSRGAEMDTGIGACFLHTHNRGACVRQRISMLLCTAHRPK